MRLAALLVIAAGTAGAAPSADTRAEIARLLDRLSASQCQFLRNGSWYEPARARAHLEQKYRYLLERDLVDSAEQFIDRAGSRSSVSGRAYQVRCPGSPPLPASAWLTQQLAALRGQ